MVTLSLRELLLLALSAAFFAVILNRGLVLAWRGLHRVAQHVLNRREQRRALKAGRRQLRTFTIDDLKE